MKSRYPIITLVFLTLFPYSTRAQVQMLTAGQHYQAVYDDVVRNHGNNVHLVMVNTQNKWDIERLKVDALTGTAEMWLYVFYSKAEHMMVIGQASDNFLPGKVIGEVYSGDWEAGMDTTRLPENWIDSPLAAVAWKSSGVQNFIDAHPAAQSTSMWLAGRKGQPQWVTEIFEGPDTLICSIDAITSEVKSCGSVNSVTDNRKPHDISIEAIHPNPVVVKRDAHLTLLTDSEHPPTLQVFNSLGRLCGTVETTMRGAGKAGAIIPAAFIDAPGVYFLRVAGRNNVAIGKLVVLVR